MRYFSIVDELNSEDAAIPEIITKHELTNTPVSLVWEEQDFGAGALPLPTVSKGIYFDSTTRAAKIDFNEIVEGFDNIFKFSIIDKFCEFSTSAGQIREHFILDENNVGYLLRYSTDPGDNDLFTYELVWWDDGVETVMLSDTITTPTRDFRIYLTLKNEVLSLQFDSDIPFTVAQIAPYNFSQFIIQGSDPGDSDLSRLLRIDLRGDDFDPEFIDQYSKLLIKQYYEKPNARGEIEFQAKSWSRIYSVMGELLEQFDVDLAVGVFLDIIGRIVFGTNARDIAQSGSTLGDDDFRRFIKTKIAKNNCTSFMISDNGISMQEVIQQLFDGEAYLIDNYDMSMTLYINENVEGSLVTIAKNLDLLPKPQGVRYKAIVSYNVNETFGFEINSEALTWDDKFSPNLNPGTFAEKVF